MIGKSPQILSLGRSGPRAAARLTAGLSRAVECAVLCMGDARKMELGMGPSSMHQLDKQPRAWGFRGDSMESTTSSKSTGYAFSLAATPRYSSMPSPGQGQASWWPSPGSSPRQLPGAAQFHPPCHNFSFQSPRMCQCLVLSCCHLLHEAAIHAVCMRSAPQAPAGPLYAGLSFDPAAALIKLEQVHDGLEEVICGGSPPLPSQPVWQ